MSSSVTKWHKMNQAIYLTNTITLQVMKSSINFGNHLSNCIDFRLQLDNLNLNLILKSIFGTFCKTDLLICPAGNCKTCYFNRWQSVTLMCHPQPNFMCSPHIDRYIKKQIFRDQSLHVQSSSNANFATRAINYIVKRFSFCFNWSMIFLIWHNTLRSLDIDQTQIETLSSPIIWL